MAKQRIATTAGYGPRLLHSTGQLHKGGPNTGLFLQVTMAHQHKIPIPGAPYTFDILADAQALGDLRTLQALKRRVVRIQLDAGDTAAFQRVVSGLK
jgi:glucose-6-phosphate isomerase/transaldolase/glucose-6-phosphate isomerase